MATTQLSIPSRYRSGVETIALLSSETVAALRNLLGTSAKVKAGKKADRSTASLAGINQVELTKILNTLGSLYSVKVSGNVSAQEFAEDLVRDLRRKKPSVLTPTTAKDAVANLMNLLSVEELDVNERSIAVRNGDEKRFCRAAVLVELRPVFAGIEGTELRRLMVSYRLKLGYHTEGDTHHDQYISLDLDDIQALRESLNQAELQGQVLSLQSKKLLSSRR